MIRTTAGHRKLVSTIKNPIYLHKTLEIANLEADRPLRGRQKCFYAVKLLLMERILYYLSRLITILQEIIAHRGNFINMIFNVYFEFLIHRISMKKVRYKFYNSGNFFT